MQANGGLTDTITALAWFPKFDGFSSLEMHRLVPLRWLLYKSKEQLYASLFRTTAFMLTGRRFRLKMDTLAIDSSGEGRIAVTVPAGAIIGVIRNLHPSNGAMFEVQ